MFGVFDVRPNRGDEPYVFQDERTGRRKKALFETAAEAWKVAENMNRSVRRMTYEVREVRVPRYYVAR